MRRDLNLHLETTQNFEGVQSIMSIGLSQEIPKPENARNIPMFDTPRRVAEKFHAGEIEGRKAPPELLFATPRA